MGRLDAQLDRQAGVISRRQAIAWGLADHDIARMLRRRLWMRVFAGVYVDHTGELSWTQHAWAAVLLSWPAALSHGSALRAAEGPGRRDESERPIHLVVARDRHLKVPDGIRLHRGCDIDRFVQWNLGPPRVRYEHSAIDVAASSETEFQAISILTRAVQSRRTTPTRLLEALAQRERIPRRSWLTRVLTDIAQGTCSVLEHGYLTRVERAHGLPPADRQAMGVGRAGRIYRDANYRVPLVIELDGRLFHDSAEGRDLDFDRDLVTQVEGRLTTRLSWGQVYDRPCWTAGQVGVLLQQRGWTGSPKRCGPSCGLCG